jgi:pimeloyl-ACP methyl ester carboxylesterase
MLMEGKQAEFFTMTFSALSNPGTFSDEDMAYYISAYEGRERLRGGFEQYRALRSDGAEIRELVANTRLRMPVLAVGGSATGEHVADAIKPHGDNVIGRVAPTGHFVAEEDPEWFLKTIREVL